MFAPLSWREEFEFWYSFWIFWLLSMSLLQLSLGSRVVPDILGCVCMSSIVFWICSLSLVLCSVWSGVKSVQVVWVEYEVWLGASVDAMYVWLYEYSCCLYVGVCCSYVMSSAVMSCVLLWGNRYVWGVYVEDCWWKNAFLGNVSFKLALCRCCVLKVA